MDAIYDGLKVLELADKRNQFAGKLLSDAGATVVQVEPPGGSPVRASGPFVDDIPDPNRCLDYWWYNTGKRSVAIDLAQPAGRSLAQRLAAQCDVILESSLARDLRPLGLDYVTASARSSGSHVQASMTDFGQDGPWCDHVANDVAHLALGGQMASSGYSEPDAPPMGGQVHQAYHIAGTLCLHAITVALIERLASGQGQYIDCAIHDCCSICTELAIPTWVHASEILYRQTGQHAAPQRQAQITLPCADGRWVNTIATEITDLHWVNLLGWMKEEGVAEDLDDPRYFDPVFRSKAWRWGSEIRAGFKRLLAKLNAEEAMLKAQEYRLAWSVVRAPEENYDDAHWTERGFFTPVDHDGRTVRYPTATFLTQEAPIYPHRAAPNLGEHTDEILSSWLAIASADLASLRSTGVIR